MRILFLGLIVLAVAAIVARFRGRRTQPDDRDLAVIEALAAHLGGEYDGWDTPIVG